MTEKKSFSEVINAVVARFYPEEGAMAAAFGECGYFADYCHTEATAKGLDVDFESVYMTLDECDCSFNAPVGTTLEQLHTWGVIQNLSHVWLVHNGRHFDAITPDGVDNPFELRLFKQVCIEVLGRDYPEELNRLKVEHTWWIESERLTVEFLEWHEKRLEQIRANPNSLLAKPGV